MEMEGSVSKGIKGGSGWVRSFLRRRMAGRTRRRRVPLPKLTPIQVVRVKGKKRRRRRRRKGMPGCQEQSRVPTSDITFAGEIAGRKEKRRIEWSERRE